MKLEAYSRRLGPIIGHFPSVVLASMEKYCFLDTQEELPVDKRANFAFVFGAEQDYLRVRRAVELYKEGVVEKVLITGGVSPYNRDQEHPEADELAFYAQKCGVEQADLFVENRASCSEENVTFSLSLLAKAGYDPYILSYVVVSSDFHLKRCITLLRNALGEDAEIYYAASSRHHSANRRGWRHSNEGRFLIFKECLRIWQAILQGWVLRIKRSPTGV